MPPFIYRLLKWSERYAKTDMIYLASGGFWLALGHGIQTIVGLGLLVAFANLLPKETFGIYQFILSIAAVASLCTLTGLGTALLRSVARGTSGSLRYALQTKMIWNIGIVVAAGSAALYYYLAGNTTFAAAFLIVVIFQPLISSFELYQSYLLGSRLFRESAVWDVVRRALPAAALLITLIFSDNLLILILAYFASNATANFIAYRFTVLRHPQVYARDPELLNYGKHLTAMGITSHIAQQLDRVLVWHFLGAVPLAAYVLAQSATEQLRKIFALIHSLTFPKIVHKSITELQVILPNKIRHYFIVVVVSVCIYILVAPLLFKIFFPTYPEAIIYTQLLALSTLAIPRQLIWQAFEAHKRKKEQYILKILSPVVRIILLLILLPLYGIWGAIVAVLGAEACTTAMQWYLFRRMKPGQVDSQLESTIQSL